jgi:transposase
MVRYRRHGPYERAVGVGGFTHSGTQGQAGEVGAASTGFQTGAGRHSLDPAYWGSLERPAGAVSAPKHLPPAFPGVACIGGVLKDSDGSGGGSSRTRRARSPRGVHRRDFCPGEKRGAGVGKTKRGKGTKIMGLTDAAGLPIAVCTSSASPHEVTLVEDTLDACFAEKLPSRVIGDKAYDSDPLDERLRQERGVELIAPHRGNRCKTVTQDGRPLRRYRRRWKVERLFAWLQNFRRLVVRYEYHLENFLAMIQLGCAVILMRRVLG